MKIFDITNLLKTQEIVNDAMDIIAVEKYNVIEERRNNITFKKLGISVNSVLYFTKDSSINCTVIKENPSRVMFEGEECSLSGAALKALNNMGYKWSSARGGDFWKYEDETLTSIRLRME